MVSLDKAAPESRDIYHGPRLTTGTLALPHWGCAIRFPYLRPSDHGWLRHFEPYLAGGDATLA